MLANRMGTVLILNLGCGTRTSSDARVVNLDHSIYLILKKYRLLRRVTGWLFGDFRFQMADALPGNILVHDLSRGIPFATGTVDAVYHSHFLEHLDREHVPDFLAEVYRALRPGGTHRLVVPDLESLCREYLAHLDFMTEGSHDKQQHDGFIARMLEQSVRKESAITRQQKPLKRWVENVFLGDARRRGETHQWMYDRVNIAQLLEDSGYRDVSVMQYDASSIPGWNDIGLDRADTGGPYKPDSLYMESQKPA